MAIIREGFFPPLLEPIFCPEVFATGFIVQRISTACVRLIFYTDGEGERIAVAKVVRPVPLLVAGPQLLRMADTVIESMGLH